MKKQTLFFKNFTHFRLLDAHFQLCSLTFKLADCCCKRNLVHATDIAIAAQGTTWEVLRVSIKWLRCCPCHHVQRPKKSSHYTHTIPPSLPPSFLPLYQPPSSPSLHPLQLQQLLLQTAVLFHLPPSLAACGGRGVVCITEMTCMCTAVAM